MNHKCLIATTCALMVACALVQANPHVIQSGRFKADVRGVAVSPSGNQICVSAGSRLKMLPLAADGRIVGGTPVHRVPLTCASDVVISPDGNYIIAAGTTESDCRITIVRRGSWDVTELTYRDNSYVIDIDVVSQRPETYIALANNRVLIVDFQEKQIVDTLTLIHPAGRILGLRAPPDGTKIATVSSEHEGATPYVCEWELEQDGWSMTSVSHDCPEMPRACCIGPDPEHLIVLTGDTGAGLAFFNTASGEFVRSCPTASAYVRDIELTRDGAWAVVVDHAYRNLTAFVGEDMRAFINPARNCDEVRSFECELNTVVEGVTVHPTLPVAYAWSPTDRRIHVVDLGEPPL